MQIEDAYALVLCGIPLDDLPIPACYAETISRFRQFETWNEPREIQCSSKINMLLIKKLKRVYNDARKGIIFGKELAIGYEAAGPVRIRKNINHTRRQSQNAKLYEIGGRKVICYNF